MIVLSSSSYFLVQRFHNLDSKDIGSKGLSTNSDRSIAAAHPCVVSRHRTSVGKSVNELVK